MSVSKLRPLILDILKAQPLMQSDIIEEVGARFAWRTVKITIMKMHHDKQIFIKDWEHTDFGAQVYPRPVWALKKSHRSKDKKKPEPLSNAEVQRRRRAKTLRSEIRQGRHISGKQKVALRYNWDLLLVKGIKRNFSMLLRKYNCDRWADEVIEHAEFLEHRIKVIRGAEIERTQNEERQWDSSSTQRRNDTGRVKGQTIKERLDSWGNKGGLEPG